MEMDELEAANERLKDLRRQQGIPETIRPGRTTSTIKAPRFLDDGKCWRHEVDKPCPLCEEAFRVETERRAELELQREQRQKDEEEAQRRREEAERQRLFDYPEDVMRAAGVPARYLQCSFDNFQGGDRYTALCRECAENPFDLVLWGGPGSGKTHLACATIREIVRRGGKASFITAAELLLEIRQTFRPDARPDEVDVIDEYASMPFLVLDDLGAEQTTPWSITTLQLIIDRRYRDLRPSIITSNLSPAEIERQLSPRIASRLAGMKVGEIRLGDYRKRRLTSVKGTA